MASTLDAAAASEMHVAPQRLYTSEEDQQILQGIVVNKQSCKQMGKLLGRDRRSVNKRFKILISRGQKQQLQTQSETAGAALSLAEPEKQQKKKKPSKKVALIACKPYRVVGFTPSGKPILECKPAMHDLAAASVAQQPTAKPAPAVAPPQQQQHRKFTLSEDLDIKAGIRAGTPHSVLAALQKRTVKDIQQRIVRIEAYERELRVHAKRLKGGMDN